MNGREDHPPENDGQDRRPDVADARGQADRRRQPDARRRSQTLDLVLLVQLQNCARAEKTDASRDALG